MTARHRLVVLALVALWHLAWAPRITGPYDWDPSYYLGVAQRIVAGEGATTGGLWNLGWLPETLVHPADLHWMPLPSRWLVPFLALGLDPWRTAQAASALLALGWAWLGGRYAERLGASPGVAALAAVAAGLGGGYAKYLTLPDSLGLYGFVGGAALLETLRGRPWPAAGWLLAAALTRSDGFLLSFACALGFAGRARWVALVGPVATGLWGLRNLLLAGEGAAALRVRALHARRAEDWLSPDPVAPAGLADRLAFVAEHAGDLVRAALLVTMVVLGPPAAFAIARRWRAWTPVWAYGLGYAWVLLLVAPAVAFEGSIFRSGAALYPAIAAAAVVGAGELARRYHPLFAGGLLVGLLAALSWAGRAQGAAFVDPFPDCEALAEAGVPAGAPLLSYDPIGTDTRCGHPGVILARDVPAATLDALAGRYRAEWALAAPETYLSWTRRPSEMDLPGWERVTERVWRRTAPR